MAFCPWFDRISLVPGGVRLLLRGGCSGRSVVIGSAGCSGRPLGWGRSCGVTSCGVGRVVGSGGTGSSAVDEESDEEDDDEEDERLLATGTVPGGVRSASGSPLDALLVIGGSGAGPSGAMGANERAPLGSSSGGGCSSICMWCALLCSTAVGTAPRST